jgi:hypothetical protein
MIDKNFLLQKLQPYKGNKIVLVNKQSTKDIINGIIETHKKYCNEYDNIYQYFVGYNLEDTCKNVFDFLKKNVKYNIEPEILQCLKSPAAILVEKNGCDCKNMALFSNGILDAYRRNENKNFDVIYRFAGYNNNANIEHVFAVINDNNEFWIDPINNIPIFDDKSTKPTNILDKKIKKMALVLINGINKNYPPYTNVGMTYESVGYCDVSMNGIRNEIKAMSGIFDGGGSGSDTSGGFDDTYGSDGQTGTGGDISVEDIKFIIDAVQSALDIINILIFGSNDGIEQHPLCPWYFAMLARAKKELGDDVFNQTYDIGTYRTVKGFNDYYVFVDTSDKKWKTVTKHLNDWTPIARLLWYLQGINSGDLDIFWASQWGQHYGPWPDGDKLTDDTPNLPYNLAQVWNCTIKKLYDAGFTPDNPWYKKEDYLRLLTIDVTKTKGYDPNNSIFKIKPEGVTNTGTTGSKLILPFGLATAAYFIFNK